MTISILESHANAKAGGGPSRTPKDRVLADLQGKSKFGGARPSDHVESLKIKVKWEPTKGALGVVIPLEDEAVTEGELEVVST